jgi:hypothetical protein
MLRKGETVQVTVNKAERDGVEQVLHRHEDVLDVYERNLLRSLLEKIDREAEAARS